MMLLSYSLSILPSCLSASLVPLKALYTQAPPQQPTSCPKPPLFLARLAFFSNLDQFPYQSSPAPYGRNPIFPRLAL